MLRALILILALQICLPGHSQAELESNLRKERELFQRYKKFREKPTPQAKWSSALERAQKMTYKVQKGDTLSEISNTFFGEKDFWPKLWSLNRSQIFNPHEIFPNQVIQFVPGSLDEAPSGFLQEEEILSDDQAKQAEPKIEFVEIDLEQLKIPPPKVRRSSDAAPLPKTLPDRPAVRLPQNPKVSLELANRQKNFAGEVELTYLLDDQGFEFVGDVAETDDGSPFTHEGQFIAVRGAPEQGEFLVVSKIGNLKADRVFDSVDIYRVEGVVKMTRTRVSSDWNRAQVLRAFYPIKVGSKLIRQELRVSRLKSADSPSADAPANVIGGAFSEERRLFGVNELVFLDNGDQGGLRNGAVLNIYRNEIERDRTSSQTANPRRIGKLQVVEALSGFSSAVVLEASEPIHRGDFTSPVMNE